jgi:riboflavin kinase/FMN adenylyltransferase
MQILRHHTSVPDALTQGVVVLGNFDGVHRGHQVVIGEAGAIARELGAPLLVLSFEPHPVSVLRPDAEPFRLTPLRVKAHYLEALGLDGLVVLSFDADLASMPAEAFVRSVLVDGLKARHVVVGYDFCFGKGRGGNATLLAEMGRQLGFSATAVSPAKGGDGDIYSSTKIRAYLKEGRPGHAAALLGRPFEIEGRVEPGDQRGRLLGFPTANLSLGEYVRPAYGVYAARAGLADPVGGESWHDAVANLGVRPTVDGKRELFEVHLIGFSGDIYGRHLRVALIEYLRGEQRFDGLDALKAQIGRDREAAERILRTRKAGAG